MAADVFQPRDDLRPGEAIYAADGGGAQRRVNAVAAKHGQAQIEAFVRVVQAETDAFEPVAVNFIGPEIGVTRSDRR